MGSPETPVDPEVKRRNLEFLRLHYRSLNEMARLPYAHADLLQLHRYFYAPLEPNTDDECDSSVHIGIFGLPKPKGGSLGGGGGGRGGYGAASVTWSTSSSPSPSPQLKQSALQRKSSYRGLHEIMTRQSESSILPTLNFGISCKRPLDESKQPVTKRAKSDKPRIDYYLRLKAKIDLYLSSSEQTKALAILRQLKFVETTLFSGGNPYNCDQLSSSITCSSCDAVATDAEVILIDML